MERYLPNVSDVLADRAIGGHAFTIIRNRGTWEGGRFVERTECIQAYGNIQSSSGGETDPRPEGGRPQSALVLRCLERVLATGDEPDVVGDEIEIRGARYKVVRVNDWSDYGYTEAYLKRKG